MTRIYGSEVVRRISVITGFPQYKVRKAVRVIVETIGEGLIRDGDVRIRGFGVFRVVKTLDDNRSVLYRPAAGVLAKVTWEDYKAEGRRLKHDYEGMDD